MYIDLFFNLFSPYYERWGVHPLAPSACSHAKNPKMIEARLTSTRHPLVRTIDTRSIAATIETADSSRDQHTFPAPSEIL